MSAWAPHHMLRRVASAVVPDAGKAAIDRRRERRLMGRVLPLNDEYVERYGLHVRRGPFTGLELFTGPESGHLIAKLVGNYERQIYPWLLDEWISGDFELVIDVGCAEGFYAVGLAREMPGAEIRAYDTYEPARHECERLAQLNGVQDRVVIGSSCTPATLAAVEQSRVALLSDCEGYEKILLDPELAPNLSRWSIIVELHENVDPEISRTIARRFQDTHEMEVIQYVRAADAAELPELAWMSEQQLRLVVDERPPFALGWALLRPRASSTPGE
jgi:hypothetical protein